MTIINKITSTQHRQKGSTNYDDKKDNLIEQESFKKSPFHYALRKKRMSKAVQSDDKKVIEYWLGMTYVD